MIEERVCISKFKEMKMSIREMAKILKRNPSSISRELKRNSYKKYKERRTKCHRYVKYNDFLLN